MILKAFWASLGLLLGALGCLLGVSWELLRASGSTKEGLLIRLGTLSGLVCSLLAAEGGLGRVLGPSLACFWCSRGPFGGCFGLRQTDFDHQNCLWFRLHINPSPPSGVDPSSSTPPRSHSKKLRGRRGHHRSCDAGRSARGLPRGGSPAPQAPSQSTRDMPYFRVCV